MSDREINGLGKEMICQQTLTVTFKSKRTAAEAPRLRARAAGFIREETEGRATTDKQIIINLRIKTRTNELKV